MTKIRQDLTWSEVCAALEAAEAERDALRAEVARLTDELQSMPDDESPEWDEAFAKDAVRASDHGGPVEATKFLLARKQERIAKEIAQIEAAAFERAAQKADEMEAFTRRLAAKDINGPETGNIVAAACAAIASGIRALACDA